MFNELLEEKVIIDLELLIKSAKEFDEDLTSYANFMREQILSVTGNN